MPATSQRTSLFTESVIRRMTRVANTHGPLTCRRASLISIARALLKAAEYAGRTARTSML